MPFRIIAKTSRPAAGAPARERECIGAQLRIGRGADSDLLLDDPAVQPDHAVIQEVSGVYILRSLSAGEPTFVNDKPATEVILTAKGTIRIGPYVLEFSRPGPKEPLTIEWKHLREPGAADEEAASATLVLPASPFAVKPAPPDLDKTVVLSQPAVAPKPVDPDATQKIDPITEPKRDDPDETRVLPPGKDRA